MVNDGKYERLNELVEEIDHVTRALKMCASVEEVDTIDMEENSGYVDIGHLVGKARKRVEKGVVP